MGTLNVFHFFIFSWWCGSWLSDGNVWSILRMGSNLFSVSDYGCSQFGSSFLDKKFEQKYGRPK
jgi:hypothetical protein